METATAVKVIITGRVQGVFYRAETKRAADSLNVTGWVRNLPDGNVEAVFQADKDTLEKMIKWCYQGSPGAAVKSVEQTPYPDADYFNSFDIRY